jgi:hypothetical protein
MSDIFFFSSLISLWSVSLLVPIFWLIRTTRFILFYLYLWQLKEYHVGRFIDHFRTVKGKSLLINKIVAVKLVLFFLLLSLFFVMTLDRIDIVSDINQKYMGLSFAY